MYLFYSACLQLSFNVQGYQIVGNCAFWAQTACLLDLGFVLSDIALLVFSHAAHEAIIKHCRDREGTEATPPHDATAKGCRTGAGREWPVPNILGAFCCVPYLPIQHPVGRRCEDVQNSGRHSGRKPDFGHYGRSFYQDGPRLMGVQGWRGQRDECDTNGFTTEGRLSNRDKRTIIEGGVLRVSPVRRVSSML